MNRQNIVLDTNNRDEDCDEAENGTMVKAQTLDM